jgi:hypothetical protein
MCVVSSGLASRSVDFPLLWPLVGGIVECVHCLGPCLVLTGLVTQNCPNAQMQKILWLYPMALPAPVHTPQGHSSLHHPFSLHHPAFSLSTLCYSLCALSTHHPSPPSSPHPPLIPNPSPSFSAWAWTRVGNFKCRSTLRHSCIRRGEASSRSFKRTLSSPFQHCPLSSPIHLVFNLLLHLYHTALRLRPTSPPSPPPPAPGNTATFWTHMLPEQPTHTRTPFLSPRTPSSIKSIRHDGMNKAGIGNPDSTLTH